ncbi:hypothetical protein OKW21_000029 [Catalinimonas alkaloidigena]|uniref:hypothetical protein n=1 Tax=Catalinimonas alkaloidigena TaxID=1075417 RepID=UPI00240692F7|nr:hypothetical protein [Catalinimonas alkaloidigena]MDF9794766.1 hypothetical protein [Catalinimonas alkaloidigena]
MKKYVFTFFICLLLVACKEEENAPVEQTTPSEMIARTWRVQAVSIDGQLDETRNYSSYRFTFNTDQTYRFLMPDEHVGRWEFASSANLLILDRNTDREQSLRMPELNENTLQLEFSIQSEKTGLSLVLYELVL